MIPPSSTRARRTLTPMAQHALQYAITDRRFFAGDERGRHLGLLRQAAILAAAGVDFLQLREKDLSPPDLLALTHTLRSFLPSGTAPKLLLNGPPAVAVAASFDGLHLPAGWTSADLASARRFFATAGLPPPSLSVSTHSLAEVQLATDAGADLILFGPVFEKSVLAEIVLPGVGLETLAAACQCAGARPVLALGGVNAANLPDCLATGAAGVAAIRLFLPPDTLGSGSPAQPNP
jgi:thiamine-phosphate pyrophosphorylase